MEGSNIDELEASKIDGNGRLEANSLKIQFLSDLLRSFINRFTFVETPAPLWLTDKSGKPKQRLRFP